MIRIRSVSIIHAKREKYIDTDSNVVTFSQSQRCFAHILFDVVGTVTSSQEHHCMSTVIDRSILWSKAIPMETATSASCVSTSLSGWIVGFIILLMTGVTLLPLNCGHITDSSVNHLHKTTCYNPASNGIVEHCHCTLKAAFIFSCKDSNRVTQLHWVLLGL
ncbi:uncharacterized protein [Palaemon carinicauda]|uniref:uncharacterized protein n=1 Tax=Palaemon carinicauda TaxID=392227 RepID=UPI0035B61D65